MFAAIASATPGAGALALLCAGGGGATCNGAQAAFQGKGMYTSVATFDVTSGDRAGLGDLPANYYAPGGKRWTVATYSFRSPWAITGCCAPA